MAGHAKHEDAAGDAAKPTVADLFHEAVGHVAAAVKKLTEAGLGGQSAADLAADIWKHFHKGA